MTQAPGAEEMERQHAYIVYIEMASVIKRSQFPHDGEYADDDDDDGDGGDGDGDGDGDDDDDDDKYIKEHRLRIISLTNSISWRILFIFFCCDIGELIYRCD